METLVLNKSYIPIDVISHKKAISLIFAQKAISIKDYDDKFCNLSSSKFLIPSVIVRTKSDYEPKKFTNILPYNRQNLYFRDNGCCMYCGKKVNFINFTVDHVIPKSLNGKICWENTVVSCSKCNNEKGNLTINQFNKKLIRKPYIPKLSKPAPLYVLKKLNFENSYEDWSQFIYWSIK